VRVVVDVCRGSGLYLSTRFPLPLLDRVTNMRVRQSWFFVARHLELGHFALLSWWRGSCLPGSTLDLRGQSFPRIDICSRSWNIETSRNVKSCQDFLHPSLESRSQP